MFFQELVEVDKYDGIWACSSILHLPIDELDKVMRKMVVALKENGIIYTSFKYGTFAGERNGRFFTDMTEETFADFLSRIDGLEVEEQWTTSDVRPGRGEEKMAEADFEPDMPRDYMNYISLIKMSKTGVWGKPSLGTKEKGEKIFNLLLEMSLDYIEDVLKVCTREAW